MFNPTNPSSSQADRPAVGGRAFGVGSTNLGALDAGLTRLEAAELAARKAEAERVAALAEIDHAARLEASSEIGARARGRAAEDSLAFRAARAEVATALHLSEQTAAAHLARAATLTSAYTTTAAVLDAGKISMRHATVILDAGNVIGPVDLPGEACTSVLDPETRAVVVANRAAYESQVLVEAVKMTATRLAPIARRIAEAYAFEDLDTRYERARQTRRVWLTMLNEGMAEIGARLPVHEATAIHSRLTQMAKRAAETEAREARTVNDADQASGVSGNGDAQKPVTTSVPGENSDLADPSASPDAGAPRRTRPEIQADLFADLLLNGTGETATGGAGSGTGIHGVIQVITFEDHLGEPVSGESVSDADDAGTSDGVGMPDAPVECPVLPELEGYGPIPVSMAQEIAAGDGCDLSHVKVYRRTGEVLTVEKYRPSTKMRRFLAARDQRCRFPGCRVPVQRCDFDHTIDAALGGPTSTTNLGALCRGHHVLKHHSGWDPKQYDNGDYEWTSPTGRIHVDEPVSRVRFVPIQEVSVQGTAPSESSRREDLHPF